MNLVPNADGPPSGTIVADGAVLGRMGPLRTRLAETAAEVEAVQRLRRHVFAEQFDASFQDADDRDSDRFDPVCDHLIVIDTTLDGDDADRIVGTYRLLRQDRIDPRDGFYSDASFQLDALVARHPNRRFVEMGRSCVLPAYRGRRALELLWQGIWAYCLRHRLDVMVGCASFTGTDPEPHRQALSLLVGHVRAEGAWAIAAQPGKALAFDPLPADAIDVRAAIRGLPPLIKGYVRLGAQFGSCAVVDAAFASIDVMVVLPTERISRRYLAHYGAGARRFAA